MTAQVRCAIYTRKSSEEGLEQAFNSLDAQREACEAYILSQRHEGWQALKTHYDDGGFSGGNMERPALKKLLEDITAGVVNTVVVYKVDRLTRSLADFAKIIELFDSKQVSFVSVTQQFNTTTSMGRLTLNVLLSFAQFEREVTAERIRDKIAASKKKGMWMGGVIPLGYDVRDRRLLVNKKEAEVVREIYCQYLQVGYVPDLKQQLDQGPIRSKVRIDAEGKRSGGGRISRGALYQILRNRLYVGEIEHQKHIYKGQHEAIIDRETWEKVQQQLSEHRQGKPQRTQVTKQSLLVGIIFDEQDNRYTPTHAVKGGRRYRYYTSQFVIRKAEVDVPHSRIPAQELERAVIERVLTFLQSQEELLQSTREWKLTAITTAILFQAAKQKAAEWTGLPARKQEATIRALIEQITIRSRSAEVQLDVKVLRQALLLSVGPSAIELVPDATPRIVLSCPLRNYQRGKEMRLIIGSPQTADAKVQTVLIKAIARSRSWYERLVSGEANGFPDLARQDQVDPSFVGNLFPCALLAPQIVETILAGQQHPQITLNSLSANLGSNWKAQAEHMNEAYRSVPQA